MECFRLFCGVFYVGIVVFVLIVGGFYFVIDGVGVNVDEKVKLLLIVVL